jgi:hypothetical protein
MVRQDNMVRNNNIPYLWNSNHLGLCVDSQESLTGEDRPELSGTTKEVTKRNNTDHILDRLINWQYLLPFNKALLYIALICFNSIN